MGLLVIKVFLLEIDALYLRKVETIKGKVLDMEATSMVTVTCVLRLLSCS